jgi:hypothetical protein
MQHRLSQDSFSSRQNMQRALLTLAMLIITVSPVCSTVDVYPPLTRETLIGTWQGIFGIGSHPVVLHIVIAPRDSDSYLSEIYPDSMKGRLFRLASCTIADGKVDLDFRPVASGEGGAWRIKGEGFGEEHRAWINSQIGYLERSTWVQDLGKAASRAAEKIPKSSSAQN